jgi:hypothetical protein
MMLKHMTSIISLFSLSVIKSDGCPLRELFSYTTIATHPNKRKKNDIKSINNNNKAWVSLGCVVLALDDSHTSTKSSAIMY